mmetsp:Transcript_10396/g.17430  ORF Transcript_10396/g.17430 Transcript_10396/m.17430 type:complete len:263 (+) Transcript_10396:929-1717(+)
MELIASSWGSHCKVFRSSSSLASSRCCSCARSAGVISAFTDTTLDLPVWGRLPVPLAPPLLDLPVFDPDPPPEASAAPTGFPAAAERAVFGLVTPDTTLLLSSTSPPGATAVPVAPVPVAPVPAAEAVFSTTFASAFSTGSPASSGGLLISTGGWSGTCSTAGCASACSWLRLWSLVLVVRGCFSIAAWAWATGRASCTRGDTLPPAPAIAPAPAAATCSSLSSSSFRLSSFRSLPTAGTAGGAGISSFFSIPPFPVSSFCV